jgi:integrase
VKRPGSSIPQFIKRVPIEIRDQMIGRKLLIPLGEGTVTATVDKQGVIRFSLGTRDPSEAKGRQADALAYLERVFEAERHNRPVELSRRHAVALSSMLYRAWVDGEDREQSIGWEHGHDGEWRKVSRGDDPDGSVAAAEFRALAEWAMALRADATGEALERKLGPLVDRVMVLPGIELPRLAPASRALVLSEFARTLRDAWELRARHSDGDYRPDPNSERFPAWQRPADAPSGDGEGSGAPSSSAKVTLTGLVDDWWKEQEKVGKSKSTRDNYGAAFKKLVAFLRRDATRRATAEDALRLTAEEVVRFKDHRLNVDKVAPRTVNDNDLAALRSVLGWAVDNKKIPTNPALGIRLKGVKKEPGRAFTEEEAKALLLAALSTGKSDRGLKGATLARRWVPWLMAYSGARVGEVAQLRKEDVQMVRDGELEYWVYTITPAAGTVKGKQARQVPVHPHLVELGFIDMVKAAPKGHLFLTPNAETGDVLGPLQGVKNRLAEAARAVVPDKSVDPNHGWRHRFTLLSYDHDVSEDLARVIMGHSGKDVHAKVYGPKGKSAGLYREMCKLPKIELA